MYVSDLQGPDQQVVYIPWRVMSKNIARETETSFNFVNESLSVDKDVSENKGPWLFGLSRGWITAHFYGIFMNNEGFHLQLTSDGTGLLLTVGFGHGASLQV